MLSIVEYKDRGATARCYQPQGSKNTTKITHLGINRIVITYKRILLIQ